MNHSLAWCVIESWNAYGHLIPGDIGEQPQIRCKKKEEQSEALVVSDSEDWLPPRDSNPDRLLQRQLSYH